MGIEIIYTGDIEEVRISNIPFAVESGATCTIKISTGSKMVTTNSMTFETDGKSYYPNITSKMEPAGIEKLPLRVDDNKRRVLFAINNFKLPVSVDIMVANGRIFSGEELYIIGGLNYNPTENLIEVNLKGKYFEDINGSLSGGYTTDSTPVTA